jgi:hypothetical protein
MADTMCRTDCRPDLSDRDVCLLVDRVAELERALANANRYLEACRDAIGAREGELLIDALQRRSQESAQPSFHDPAIGMSVSPVAEPARDPGRAAIWSRILSGRMSF